TAYLVASIFDAAGMPSGTLGTVAYKLGPREDDVREAERTTPEAPDVQRMLREMVDRGCRAGVMEVSSHALALRRVDATTFAAGVFTNLTRDHLDFHADMESYFQAKRRLFAELLAESPKTRRASVVNLDDPRGEDFRAATPVGVRCLTYGRDPGSRADIRPIEVRQD